MDKSLVRLQTWLIFLFLFTLANLAKVYIVEATPLAPHSFGKINLPSSQPTLILRVGVCTIRLKILGEADKRGRSDAPSVRLPLAPCFSLRPAT